MLTLDNLSFPGQVKLFDLVFSSLVFGISSIPVCAIALAVWASQLKQSAVGILVWGGVYVLFAIGIRLVRNAYNSDSQKLTEVELIKKWLPIIYAICFLHGIGLTAPLFISMGKAPFEFTLLCYVIIAAIIAAFATHLTTLIKAFMLLFAASWGISTIVLPWVFPQQWHFMILLMAAFAGSIYRHALMTHQFFLKQIWLEEEGARLAERYKAAKEEAETALQAKNQFLTTASHDLRQPVHAMGFLIESILRRNKDPAIDHALNDLKLSVRSVTQMFNSLLDLSKIELGSVKVHLETVSLYPLIEDIVTVFSEEAHARQLDLRIGKTFPNASAVADSLLLRQTVVNLVQNALRYTQSGGVLIGVRKREHTWQIEVWDTGVGVALPDQNKIYSPFYRNEHAWHLNSAGHGLGLAVVARCVELMGAHHGFASREGQGSKFWLRLPRAKHVQEDLVTIPHDVPMQLDDRPPLLAGTCLVVDDDPQVCKAWNAMLSAWGIEVKCAASAKEAFSVLDEGFVPQAILCDQRLRAGENGYELLQAILDCCPIAHGAMVSGEFNSPELLQAEEEGYLVLHKPLEPEVLYAILDRWLKQVDSPVIFRSD